jgi:hypothetical protein
MIIFRKKYLKQCNVFGTYSSTNLPIILDVSHTCTCKMSTCISQPWNVSKATHFTEFLQVLNASMGMLSKNILLFVDSCVTHPLDILLLRNAEVLFSHQTAQVC